MIFFPKRLLITGGAGFIASNFIRFYQNNYPELFIVNLDKLTYAACFENLMYLPYPNSYSFAEGDIGDRGLIDSLLRKFEIDTIIHFAAETHVDRSIETPELFFQTNVLGTLTLLEASRRYWLEEKKWDETHCRFHHISTDEVYGSLKKDEPAFTETTPYAPSSPYSSSKAASDHAVRAYHRTYGLPISITNCSNNYGPVQHREKFIPTIINRCVHQQAIPVYGDGSNIRDWLYVEDHCRAIDDVIRKGRIGQTYNVGGNTELSNLEVVSAVCEALEKISTRFYNCKRLISFVNDRKGHDWRYAINAEKIKTEIQWQPKENFSSGILKTVSAATRYLDAVESLPFN
jgi:dTDP-glucose 4,6-dehydratase